MNLKAYLTEQLDRYLPCEWKILYSHEEEAIQITIRFIFLCEYPVFWDETILIHDPIMSGLDPRHYPFVITYEANKGIQKGLVDILIKHLRLVVQQANILFKETVDQSEVFAVDWQIPLFNQTIKTYQEIERYDVTYMTV